MRLSYAVILTAVLLAISTAHAERVGVEVVSAGWGDEGSAKALPGDENIPLVIKIKNADPRDLRTIKCTLKFSRPFYFEYFERGAKVRTSTQEIVLGELKANATATLRYSLSIDPEARPGTYRAELKVVYVEDPVKRDIFPIFLTISGSSKLVVENLTLTPASPMPGDRVRLVLKIKNAGSRKLSEIEAKLLLNKPFLPEGLEYYRYISSLEPGREKTLQFRIKIAGDAQPGGYTIPLELGYRDVGGHRVKQNFSLGVSVATPASFEIASVSFNPAVEYKDGIPVVPCCGDVELEFDVVNTARAEANFVEVAVGRGEGYSTRPRSTYIGTLNSDDFSTVRFTLKFKENSGMVKIPVDILYTDESSKRKKLERNILVFVKNDTAPEVKNKGNGIIARFLRWLLGI